jgi:two-component system, NarL family, sensor kinase
MRTEENVIFITIVGTSLLLFLSITLFIFYLSYNKRKFRHTREKQQLQSDFHQELLRTQLEIQEQTFQNISQEIHDNIGQMLSLVKLNLNTADFNELPAAIEKVTRSKELVSKAISDLRDLSKSMNPEIIMKIGLTEALERELLMMAKTGQYEVNLSQYGDYYKLDPHKELIIFRIFQELLNNIINHAKAKTVNVTLEYQPEHFRLTVSDDGSGFDITACNEHCKGLGIQNMLNRAKLIGAEIQFMSVPQKGTNVTVGLAFSKDI